MFSANNLDERERLIYEAADSWWATRFRGRGVYDRIGPFPTQEVALEQIANFFRYEEANYPPTSTVIMRPFAVYASSKQFGEAHVIVGTIDRFGKIGVTHKEISLKREEERKLARARRRRNAVRSD